MTQTPISPAECEALERRFLLGLGRQNLSLPSLLADTPAEIDPVLASLALLGQRRRFRRPGPLPPPPEQPRRAADETRPLLTPQAGKRLNLFIRLAAMPEASILVSALLTRLAASGRRPHPFETGKLLALVKKQGCALGAAERAWLASLDPVTEGNPAPAPADIPAWMNLPRAARLEVLTGLRRRDPATARAQLAACLPGEPASSRAELLETLAIGISAEDTELLEGLATDRAKSVREIAEKLLARIPGHPKQLERIGKAAASLRLATGGLLRRSRSLQPVDPAAPAQHYQGLFEGLSIDALAARFDLDAPGFIGLIPPGEPAILLPLAGLAAANGRIDQLGLVIDRYKAGSGGWGDIATALTGHAPALSAEQRDAVLRRLGPFGTSPFPRHSDWVALAQISAGPLPQDLALAIFDSAGWARFVTALEEPAAQADLAGFAALLPPPALERLTRILAGQPELALGRVIALYAGVIAALDKP